MIEEFDLSVLEKWWLRSRGGRGAENVFVDVLDRKYILMHDKNGKDERVYLPDSLQIKNEINYHG
jgi:hypothetical protein